MFTIIPVLDIRAGSVVRARAGERADYAPIDTPLADGADPVTVLRAILDLAPFTCLYVADLDGIEQGRPQLDVVRRLADAAAPVEIWVDAGVADAASARQLQVAGAARVVIGSESQHDPDFVQSLQDRGEPFVLSLDFRGDDFVGAYELLGEVALWPDTVIVMTLARVGSAAGPDLSRLLEIQTRAETRRVFAAGGVRGPDDIIALAAAGLDGVLVASAIHDGSLSRDDLARLA